MSRIFWIKCPNCNKKFYAQTADFRKKNRKLFCPFCKERFTDEESPEIWDDNGYHVGQLSQSKLVR